MTSCKSVYVALPLHVCSNSGITGSGYQHSLGMSERVKWSWITSRHLKNHVDLYIGQECPGMPRKSKGFHHIIFLVPPWHKGWIICTSLCNSVPLRPQFSVPNCFPKGTEFEMLTELIVCTVVDGRVYLNWNIYIYIYIYTYGRWKHHGSTSCKKCLCCLANACVQQLWHYELQVFIVNVGAHQRGFKFIGPECYARFLSDRLETQPGWRI